jgi:hypothetical protein
MTRHADGTATVAELALAVVPCPRCGAAAGESCAAAMRRKLDPARDRAAIGELRAIELGAPHLAHPERLRAAGDLVDSAVAYGLVKRIPERDG